VRYVVPTHYHFDHSGGLRTYIAKGITIVTTPGNKAFIERLAKAPHTIKPDSLSRQPKAPVIETFTGKRVFDDGTHTLEVRDIGPSPHVAEAVIGYLPKQKAVFVSDLFTIPPQGPFPPASPALVDFADKLQKQGLACRDDRSRPRPARHARRPDGGAGGAAAVELGPRYSLRSARIGSTRAAARAGTRLAAAATSSRIAAASPYASGSSGLTP
jgi:hypothetical protein